MTTPGKFHARSLGARSSRRTRRPHWRRPLAGLAVAALALTGCSADEGDGEGAQTTEANPLEQYLTPDARPDQRAAGGGASMAMDLGFDQARAASEAGLEAVRSNTEERAAATQDINVTPQQCAQQIAELDWSPILADSQTITRVDFTRENFQGAGSIEVAGITEDTGGNSQAADEVAAHRQAIETITTTCSNLTMQLADETEPDWAAREYTFEAEPITTDTGSGLRWQRYPTQDPDTHDTTALTLSTEVNGYAVMVAFIGGDEISDPEFVDISEAILASAVAQLD